MKTIKLASASRSLAEYAKELDDQLVVVTDRNKPVAAGCSIKKRGPRIPCPEFASRVFGNNREVTPAIRRWQDFIFRRDEKSGSTLSNGKQKDGANAKDAPLILTLAFTEH